MVSLWWLADEWVVPQISKVPTTHLLLGVGLVGVGQVSFCLVHSADTIKRKTSKGQCAADPECQYVQRHW